MKIPRRGLLKGGAILAASMMLPNRTKLRAAMPGSAHSPEVAHVESSLVSYLSSKGLGPVAPAPFVTGDDGFNGGLRYDDSDVGVTPGTFFFQPCARTDDIAEKHRGDVLPFFHILRVDGMAGEGRSDAFAHSIAYLTGSLGLDPARLAFVSIPPFEGLRPSLTTAGLDWRRQVILRDPDAALAAGDGSGIFRHPGKPALPAIPTAGIYYWVGHGAPTTATYPQPDGWTEIGELFIAENDVASVGFGLERLAYAATGRMPTWHAQLTRLAALIERDGTPGAPPPGKAMFMER